MRATSWFTRRSFSISALDRHTITCPTALLLYRSSRLCRLHRRRPGSRRIINHRIDLSCHPVGRLRAVDDPERRSRPVILNQGLLRPTVNLESLDHDRFQIIGPLHQGATASSAGVSSGGNVQWLLAYTAL